MLCAIKTETIEHGAAVLVSLSAANVVETDYKSDTLHMSLYSASTSKDVAALAGL